MIKLQTKLVNIFFVTLILIQCSHELKQQMISEKQRLISKIDPIGDNSNKMSGLILEAPKDSQTELQFGTKNDFFSFAFLGSKEKFEINYVDTHTVIFNKDNSIEIFPKVVTLNNGLDFTGNFKIRGVNQWKLFQEEDFSIDAFGWSNNTISSCSGINMMGGYCKYAGGETSKTFINIPPHEQIRIEATYHFIDAWNGETGYMKVGQNEEDMDYFWTETYSAFAGLGGLNVCGGHFPEGKFSSYIDVYLDHTEDNLRLSFGSTLQADACENSFGVSAVKIYIR